MKFTFHAVNNRKLTGFDMVFYRQFLGIWVVNEEVLIKPFPLIIACIMSTVSDQSHPMAGPLHSSTLNAFLHKIAYPIELS